MPEGRDAQLAVPERATRRAWTRNSPANAQLAGAAVGPGGGRRAPAGRRHAARGVHGRAVATAARRRARGAHARASGVRDRRPSPLRCRCPIPEPGARRGVPRLHRTLATTVPPPPTASCASSCALLTVEADPAAARAGPHPDRAVAGRARRRARRPAAAARRRRQRRPNPRRHRRRDPGRAGARRLLQRYTLVGIDRRGAGIDDLDCGPVGRPQRLRQHRPGRRRLPHRAERAAGAGRHGGPGLLSRPCGRADRLPHGLHGRGHRAGAGRARRRRTCRRSASATAPPPCSIWARTHPAAAGRLVLDGPPNPALDEPDAGEARAAAAESAFDAFAAACAAGPDCPLGADPRAAVSALGRPPARPADHLDRRAAADRGHDGHGAPHGAGRAGRVAGPRRRARPGAGRRSRRPDQQAGPPGHTRRRVRHRARDRLQRRAAADDARRGRRPDPPVAHRLPLFGATMAQRLLACGPWPTASPAPVPDPGPGFPRSW